MQMVEMHSNFKSILLQASKWPMSVHGAAQIARDNRDGSKRRYQTTKSLLHPELGGMKEDGDRCKSTPLQIM